MGGSMPGKVMEQVNYAGGLYNYGQDIRKALPNFDGFQIVRE